MEWCPPHNTGWQIKQETNNLVHGWRLLTCTPRRQAFLCVMCTYRKFMAPDLQTCDWLIERPWHKINVMSEARYTLSIPKAPWCSWKAMGSEDNSSGRVHKVTGTLKQLLNIARAGSSCEKWGQSLPGWCKGLRMDKLPSYQQSLMSESVLPRLWRNPKFLRSWEHQIKKQCLFTLIVIVLPTMPSLPACISLRFKLVLRL